MADEDDTPVFRMTDDDHKAIADYMSEKMTSNAPDPKPTDGKPEDDPEPGTFTDEQIDAIATRMAEKQKDKDDKKKRRREAADPPSHFLDRPLSFLGGR